MAKKEIDFGKMYQEIEAAVQILESGDQSIGDNIKTYQTAVEKIKIAQKALKEAETKIREISAE